MVGPSGTLSRCAPTITTSWVDPARVWASTLREVTALVLASSRSVVVAGLARSSAPADLLTLTIGTVWELSSISEPGMNSSSTLFATTTATAPSLAAMASFSANRHFPRSTNTTAPLTLNPS